MPRKSDLLLLQDITYGELIKPSYASFNDITSSLTSHDVGFDWVDDILFVPPPILSISGPITDNSPIDVVSWAVQGTQPKDLLAPWKLCGVLLSRI